MNEVEREKFLKVIKEYTKKFKADKVASTSFLIELGMLTSNGKLKKEFKCIQSDRA